MKPTLVEGVPPAVFLVNPKFPHNVGAVLRACSCYDLNQLWFSGKRVQLTEDVTRKTDWPRRFRLPREERMKGYKDVQLVNADYVFDAFGRETTVVAIEVRENAESLLTFEHPENALYVFGPEDGGLTRKYLQHCHRFVAIPTKHCLNLAAAVNVVLYDRLVKRYLGSGDAPLLSDTLVEQRGWPEADDEREVVHGRQYARA